MSVFYKIIVIFHFQRTSGICFSFILNKCRKQLTFIFHFLWAVGMKGWREGIWKDGAWFCTQSRSAATAGVNETCWKTAAAGLDLMLKVILRARRKGDKGAGFAAPFICAHAHTHFSYWSNTTLRFAIGVSWGGLRRPLGVCSVLEKQQTIHNVYQEIPPSRQVLFSRNLGRRLNKTKQFQAVQIEKKLFFQEFFSPSISVMSSQVSCASIISNIHSPQEIKGVSSYLPSSKKGKICQTCSIRVSREIQATDEKTLTCKPLCLLHITLNKSQYQHRCSLAGWQLCAVGTADARGWGGR